MRIVTRKIGETVVIDDDIYCTILSSDGKQIRMGFDAPRHLPINRFEIQQKKEASLLNMREEQLR